MYNICVKPRAQKYCRATEAVRSIWCHLAHIVCQLNTVPTAVDSRCARIFSACARWNNSPCQEGAAQNRLCWQSQKLNRKAQKIKINKLTLALHFHATQNLFKCLMRGWTATSIISPKVFCLWKKVCLPHLRLLWLASWKRTDSAAHRQQAIVSHRWPHG